MDDSISPLSCPQCSSVKLVGYGVKRGQIITDLPNNGAPTFVAIERRRFRCRECGRTFFETLNGVDEKRNLTQRLISYIEQQSLSRTYLSISKEVGVVEGTVRNIFNAYKDRLEQSSQFKTPDFIAFEPIFLVNKPRFLVCNVRAQTIIDILDNQGARDMQKFLRTLSNPNSVKHALIEMDDLLRKTVRDELLMADMVVSRRCFTTMILQNLEKTRQFIRDSLSPNERRCLVQDKYILSQRKKDLLEYAQKRLEVWKRKVPPIYKAYMLKEGFCDLFEATGKKTAIEMYALWANNLGSANIIQEIDPLWRSYFLLSGWRMEYYRWFEHPVLRKYEDAVATFLKSTHRLGRSDSFAAVRAKILSMESAKSDKGLSLVKLAETFQESK